MAERAHHLDGQQADNPPPLSAWERGLQRGPAIPTNTVLAVRATESLRARKFGSGGASQRTGRTIPAHKDLTVRPSDPSGREDGRSRRTTRLQISASGSPWERGWQRGRAILTESAGHPDERGSDRLRLFSLQETKYGSGRAVLSCADQMAGVGAVSAGASAAAEAEGGQRGIIRRCLAGRGHQVLN